MSRRAVGSRWRGHDPSWWRPTDLWQFVIFRSEVGNVQKLPLRAPCLRQTIGSWLPTFVYLKHVGNQYLWFATCKSLYSFILFRQHGSKLVWLRRYKQCGWFWDVVLAEYTWLNESDAEDNDRGSVLPSLSITERLYIGAWASCAVCNRRSGICFHGWSKTIQERELRWCKVWGVKFQM
jgi:hypothetical protein